MDRRKQVEQWLALRDRLGLTYEELSRHCGLRPGTLAHWAWRLKREAGTDGTTPEFVEWVTRASPPDSTAERSTTRVAIELGSERRVIVDAAIGPEHLTQILSVVGRC